MDVRLSGIALHLVAAEARRLGDQLAGRKKYGDDSESIT